MTTTRESVLDALQAALAAVLELAPDGPLEERNAPPPKKAPAIGRVILRDGDPGEPEVLLSPLTYIYDHEAEILLLTDRARFDTDAAHRAAFDDLVAAIGEAIAADRTLGGLCDWAEGVAPETITVPVEGGEPLKGGRIGVLLRYATSDPLA
jgi:hypothetical protein